jgi:hypothetical protein
LASCGGGGGGSAAPYSITLRVDTSQLPLNVSGDVASIGGKYTTTLYVLARDSAGRPIPSAGEETFACAVIGGLDSGALYYLDGNEDHQTTVTLTDGTEYTYPNAYRSITLGANSGSATFHYTATDVAGTATIRCTVTEPDTNIQRSAQVTIRVGGDATGRVSQVVIDKSSSPNYLYRQGLNGTTQMVVQASMVDEAGQSVADPVAGANNLQVRIVPDDSTLADDDASLRGVNASGASVTCRTIQARSINGQAQFTVISGSNTGTLLIEAIGDRADNNISNGITEPVYNYASIYVISELATTPTAVTITTGELPSATYGVPYGVLLEAEGGSAPYTWSLASTGLPTGLSLSTGGIISGTPSATTGTSFSFVAKVVDSLGTVAQKTMTLAYTPPTVVDPDPIEYAPTIYYTDGKLSATGGASYAHMFSASGGTTPYTWAATGLPDWLSLSSTGILTGTPPVDVIGATFNFGVTVTGANSLNSSRVFALTVTAP